MSKKMDNLDTAAVAQGREGFERGVSLLTVITMVMAAAKGAEADEARALSYALGFAEALIDRIRNPFSIGEPVDPPDGVIDFAKQSIGGA